MDSASTWRVVLGSVFARYGCAALLLVAALLKAQLLFTDPALGVTHGWRWLQAGLVEYELLLAAWLLCGVGLHWGRRIALVTFVGFGCYAFFRGVSGEASCGCYGRVAVSPWWSFGMDAALALSLLVWKPPRGKANGGPAHGRIHFTIPACLALVAALAVFAIPLLLIADWHPGSGSFLLLQPEEWIGKPFPLVDDIDVAEGEQLTQGPWILVFYHHDCPKCRQALRRYQRLAEQLQRRGDGTKIAWIEVPPYGPEDGLSAGLCRRGRLSERKEWIMATPAEVRMRDGLVTAATSEFVAEEQ